jgi:hypothetical protein
MSKASYGQLKSESRATPGTGHYRNFNGQKLLVSAEYSYEWLFNTYTNIDEARQNLLDEQTESNPKKQGTKLESGTLITIFNTISKGEVLWSDTVSLERKRRYQTFPRNPQYGQQEVFGMWVHGFEEKLSPKNWASMFFNHLPAKLEKPDGSVVYGALEPFFETGTEGVIWSLLEYGKTGYDALHSVSNDDNLTVYKSVTDGNIHWQGTLDLTALQKPQPLSYLPHLETKRVFNNSAATKLEQACIGNFPARISLTSEPHPGNVRNFNPRIKPRKLYRRR